MEMKVCTVYFMNFWRKTKLATKTSMKAAVFCAHTTIDVCSARVNRKLILSKWINCRNWWICEFSWRGPVFFVSLQIIVVLVRLGSKINVFFWQIENMLCNCRIGETWAPAPASTSRYELLVQSAVPYFW